MESCSEFSSLSIERQFLSMSEESKLSELEDCSEGRLRLEEDSSIKENFEFSNIISEYGDSM